MRFLTASVAASSLAVTLASVAALADGSTPRGAREAPSAVKVAAKPIDANEHRRREQQGYSPYEKDTIKDALKQLGAEIEDAPEGKTIERVDIVTLEVIEDRDPAPRFLNIFHWTTRPYVIEREVLLRVGDPYREELVDETARNLRAAGRISLVLCFPVKGSDPKSVRLVVITKDVWSLRLNTNFRFAGGRLETLFLQPSEENIFGTHNSIALQFSFNPVAYALGGRFSMPHIGGSQMRLITSANVIVNRESGQAEGSFGSFTYGQPLYSTQAEWAWGVSSQWRQETFRRLCPFDKVTPCVGEVRAFDAEVTEQADAIPYSYQSDVIVGENHVTRSFGRTFKHDISIGIEVVRRSYRAHDLSRVDPAAASEFIETALPISDTSVGPFVRYATYETRHKHVLDFETLGLTEDASVGHNVELRVMPITKALNSSRNFVSVFAAGRYAVPLGDGMAVGFVESGAQLGADEVYDAALEAGGRVVTPRLGFGRLVVDARVLYRFKDYYNRLATLGGDDRLRGYPTQAFIGRNVITANLEFRSRPVEILACQLGGVAFFDAGDAYNFGSDLRLKQSAGFGLRILFPQFDRTVIRADWGFPLTRGYREPDGLPGDIVVTFDHAFSFPDIPTGDGID